MQKLNYQKILDKEIESLQKDKRHCSLLLHCCCAPCASYVTEYMCKYFDVSTFFFNPNIYPYEEYQLRLKELFKLWKLSALDFEILEGRFDEALFYSETKNLENEVEGSLRCEKCIRLRLEETAKQAKKLGFDYFTTTLSISPHKNADFINQCGKELSDIYGVKFLYADFKKKEGFKKSLELSKKYNLYRQNYCGCKFSCRA